MDDLHPPGQSSPDVPIIIQRLDFSHSDLISEVISDYRTSGAETIRLAVPGRSESPSFPMDTSVSR